MPDTKVPCSEKINDSHIFGGRRCARAAVVTRDGKPYCRQHDPERIKEQREVREAVCQYAEGSVRVADWCGAPATSKTTWGSPRCALHTEEAIAYDKRLRDAAPELLAALEDILAQMSGEAKTCGHAYYCICPGDRAVAVIRKVKGQDA